MYEKELLKEGLNLLSFKFLEVKKTEIITITMFIFIKVCSVPMIIHHE